VGVRWRTEARRRPILGHRVRPGQSLIRHLERHGYLTLESDPGDQRARIVRLTDRGWALIGTIRGVVEDVEAAWSQRLGRPRFETLRRILTELAAAVDAHASRPGAAA
jgi:DNA-binding MarR family transcriptional regulator